MRAKAEVNGTGVGNLMMVAGLLAVLVISAGLALTFTKPAHADTTFTVTSTADPGNGVCDIVCTLREAITAANDTPGRDTINFRLSNTGEVRTITPTSELPGVTESVTIDGYSQLGSTPNTLDKGTNAVLKVQLDGSNAGFETSGLVIDGADNVVVRGLVVNRFDTSGIRIRAGGSSNRIEGNFLGTDSSGTLDLGNGNGVSLNGNSNVVGGSSPDDRNLISGNSRGVSLTPGAAGTKVQGNLVGTEKDGTVPLGNEFEGVAMTEAKHNLIGGSGLGEANTIAFNGSHGVSVVSFLSEFDGTGNRILANSIFSNGGLGTDLEGGTENAAGATANDPKDPDSGPNDLQNKPIVTSAKTVGGKTTVLAKLNSTPRDAFVVEFFSNPSANEGKKFMGDKAVSTDADGNVAFTFVPSQAVPAGQRITATATNAVDANTSEFSAPRTVVAQ